MVVLNDADEIDINKIKSMIDSRENYKRAKKFEDVVSPTNNIKDEEIDYKFDEIDDSNYDINEIIFSVACDIILALSSNCSDSC